MNALMDTQIIIPTILVHNAMNPVKLAQGN
jgi:hypothetical protein